MARVADRLLEHAQQWPTRHALLRGDCAWSYAELAAAAGKFARHLQRTGVAPGHRLAIACANHDAFLVAYLGATLTGATPVIVAPENLAVIDPEVAATGGVVIDGSPTAPPTVASPYGVHALTATPASITAQFRAGAPLPAPGEPRTGHILYTSGSTGKAKAIAWSDRRLEAVAWSDWLFAGEAMGLLSPLHHAAGIQLMYRTLCSGKTLVLIEDPHAIALACEQLARHRVSAIKCMPPHVEMILNGGVELPACVERIQVSGAPIDGARLAEFAAHVAPARVRKVYGTAESGTLTCLLEEEIASKGDTVGRPHGQIMIAIHDADGSPCPPRQTGEIVATIPEVPEGDGYLDPSPEQAARFRGNTLFTKDRGYFDEDGYLVLTERSEELIKSAGKLVSAAKIERVLRAALPGVSLAIARIAELERGEAPCVVYVATDSLFAEREWLTLSQRELADYEAPRLFLPVHELPVTPTGKLARATLNERAAAVCALFPERRVLGPRLCPSVRLSATAQILLTGVVHGPVANTAALGLALLGADGRRLGEVALTFVDGPPPLAVVTATEADAAGWLAPYAATLQAVAAALSGTAGPLTIAGPLASLSAPPIERGTRFSIWQHGGDPAGARPPAPSAAASLRALEADPA